MKTIKALLYLFSCVNITCYGTQIAIQKKPDNTIIIRIMKNENQEGSLGGIIENQNKNYIYKYVVALKYTVSTQEGLLKFYFDPDNDIIPEIHFEISTLFKSIVEQINQLFKKVTDQINALVDEQKKMISLHRLDTEGIPYQAIEESQLLTQLYTSITDLVEEYIKQLPNITYFELQKITYKPKRVTEATANISSSTPQPTKTEASAVLDVPQTKTSPLSIEQKQETLYPTTQLQPSPSTSSASLTQQTLLQKLHSNYIAPWYNTYIKPMTYRRWWTEKGRYKKAIGSVALISLVGVLGKYYVYPGYQK